MFKALLKKQFKELGMTYTSGGRGGSGASAGRLMKGKWILIVYALCLFSLGAAFSASAEGFSQSLFSADLKWLYFAYMGMMSMALGIFGSVFGVVSGIYKAKDNELLLSMPIPPAMIVFTRMLSLWLITLVCVLTGLIPTAVVYGRYYTLGTAGVLSLVIATFTLSFAAFAVSCLAGWVVALISNRLRNRSIVTVLIALVFLAGYYVFYFNVNKLLARLATEAEVIGDRIRRTVYPLYVYGRGCTGKPLYALLAFAMAFALLLIVYILISRSFTGVATANTGLKKKHFSGKVGAGSSVSGTLLRKEFKRYLSSANYMLNCSLGTFLMPVAAIALVIKADAVRGLLEAIDLPMEIFGRYLAVALGYAVMFLCTMNELTAPSLSLEGRNYWILRSLPVDLRQVAKAKLGMHFALTGVPMLLVIAAVYWVFRPGILNILLIALMPVSFIMLQAYIGLAANIRFPRMDWVNEMVAVKQGASVLLTLLGSIVLVIGFGALYFLVLIEKIEPTVFILAQSGLFAVIALILRGWIMKKGVKIMESLPC